jgi:hypothetical protein
MENKPRRFIVEIYDGIAPMDAFWRCLKVAQRGMISANGKQHCHHTEFADGSHVDCNLNKGSERFRVSKGYAPENFSAFKSNGK